MFGKVSINSIKDANAHSKITAITLSFQNLYLFSHTAQHEIITISHWMLDLVRVLEALQFSALCYYLYFYSFKVSVVRLQGGITLSQFHSQLLVFAVKHKRLHAQI